MKSKAGLNKIRIALSIEMKSEEYQAFLDLLNKKGNASDPFMIVSQVIRKNSFFSYLKNPS